MQRLIIAIVSLVTAGLVFAQQAQVNLDWAPHKNAENLALRYGTGTITPIVNDNKTVTFKLVAPKATSVNVNGFPFSTSDPIPMAKNSDGIWEVTTGPHAPDIYYYRLDIDGAMVADHDNSFILYGLQPAKSMVTVHGDGPSFYDATAVPHGTVTRHIYSSTVTQGERELFVYTPPGYDPNTSYPMLILMGGSGELAAGWLDDGRANFIMDNLLAEGKAKPTIIVFPNNQLLHRNTPDHVKYTFDLTSKEIFAHILPLVESNYSTIKSPRGRAIAGLSMGGRQSRHIGFRNLDTFGSFGLFSAGRVDSDESFEAFLADPETNDKIDLLYTGLGPLEPPERYGGRLHGILDEHNIDHEYYVGGAGHEWITWRHQLHARFLPQLWQHLDSAPKQ